MRAIEAEILDGRACSNSNGGGGGSSRGDSRVNLEEYTRTLVDLGCGTGKFTREILPFAETNRELYPLSPPPCPTYGVAHIPLEPTRNI